MKKNFWLWVTLLHSSSLFFNQKTIQKSCGTVVTSFLTVPQKARFTMNWSDSVFLVCCLFSLACLNWNDEDYVFWNWYCIKCGRHTSVTGWQETKRLWIFYWYLHHWENRCMWPLWGEMHHWKQSYIVRFMSLLITCIMWGFKGWAIQPTDSANHTDRKLILLLQPQPVYSCSQKNITRMFE